MGRMQKSAKAKAKEQKHLERLGKHLKELREIKGLTPQDLAEQLGVTPQYIYMIESGKAKPSEKRLNELASALGDLADEFRTTAIARVEDEFAARLEKAGLSPDEIDEAARRVSARVKENVVMGREPLRVSRSMEPDASWFGALENNEEIHALAQSIDFEPSKKSASEYAESIREDFGAGASPTSGNRNDVVIEAGPDAKIVVDRRKVSRSKITALQDIGRVIEHLLK